MEENKQITPLELMKMIKSSKEKTTEFFFLGLG